MKIVSNGKTIEIPGGANGVPAGGATGQMLAKASDADFDTQWVNVPGAEGTSGVTSFNGRDGSVVPQEGDYTAEMVGALPNDTEIPAKTSDLTNDSGFATTAEVNSAIQAAVLSSWEASY